MKQPRAFHPLDPRSAGQRLLLASAVGLVAWLVVPGRFAATTRALLAWNLAGVVLLGLAFAIIARSDSRETRRRAAAYDPGRGVVGVVVILAGVFGLVAATIVLRQGKAGSVDGDLHVALCVATVVISWLLTHTAFTLRYAHLYYRGKASGGLEFAGGEPPDDLDFAYFAFTIGMCFQVSDTAVASREIRRTVLVQALLSFAYNTVVLALSLNVLAGQLG